jgi:hypothetical protein
MSYPSTGLEGAYRNRIEVKYQIFYLLLGYLIDNVTIKIF